jgi:DNA-binding IclR family transcriptional regulator
MLGAVPAASNRLSLGQILATYDPEVAARMLPERLERYTGKTLTSLDGLLKELATVRETFRLVS